MGTVAVERKKLYEQVWSMPGQQLAVLYGISDVGLAKVCKRYNIPRPARGYWARKAAGQRVGKPPLPKPRDGDEIIYLKGWDMPDAAVQALVKESRVSAPAGKPVASEAHPLAVITHKRLLFAKPDPEGLLRVSSPAFDVRVSPASVDRCATVLDALIKRWEGRGGSVSTAELPDAGTGRTVFAIEQDGLNVRLAENVDESKPLTDLGRLTGNLALHITGDDNRQFRRKWSDTKSQRVEKLIGAFIETLANALAVKRQERLDAECVARQRDKVAALREASEQEASHAFHLRQHLMQDVDRWHDAQRIRAYLEAVRTAVESGRCRTVDNENFTGWLDWAAKFADSIDPLVNRPLPEGKPPPPQNTPVDQLDLTAATRAALNTLGARDTDDLRKFPKDAVRDACEGRFGRVWNELTRVLEGLGYDVSKRERAESWW